jgi:hypothetical protein
MLRFSHQLNVQGKCHYRESDIDMAVSLIVQGQLSWQAIALGSDVNSGHQTSS